ncbi:oxygenase MpaB family protein [Patulibacter brassicae]|uniref:Oxygenase MpaB family protein n=1 Tax=Patulibacter brassicae TaxID=1705717 RepID=A0ABU4VLV6_9ACTN|nr:oxygenase MpaB family protein [Patulibacter brassicae]MDX8152342.1 oxygenase MpaB family protein [Patulibacter brassicae]
MGSISRRQLLKAGGAMGALGVVGAAAPTWAWSATQSVAGLGGQTPPWEVWDPEADPVVAAVIERGETARVNALLRGWTRNGQALPAGLPADLHAFLEQARRLPEWTDTRKLAAAVAFNERRGTYLGVSYGFVSGMMSTVIPHEARAVYSSKGGADMKRRISRTAKFGYDIGARNAFRPDGSMVVTAVKTRLAHAGVRHLLPRSAHWSATADERIPISQRDVLVTWHSLPTSVMRAMKAWGVRISGAEADAFLHSWQVAAHLLGVRDEYIPATWAAANAQAPQILDPVLAPTPEGIELARILVNLAAEVDGGALSRPLLQSMTRHFLGDRIADWLQLPRNPALDGGLAASWPAFVGLKEAGLLLPGSDHLSWAFDEVLRLGALWYLGDGQELHIEIPDRNNPNRD